MGVAESGKSGFRVSAKGPSTMAWDSTCDEWLISEGYCFCGGLADLKGVIYAAAPAEGEAGWGFIWADPHEQVVLQEDGSEKTVTVNEAEGIAMAATGKKHANGLWIGKQKYQIRQSSGADFNGTERKVVSCGRPKEEPSCARLTTALSLASMTRGRVRLMATASRPSMPSCRIWWIIHNESSTELNEVPFLSEVL